MRTQGIHHITAIAGAPQANIDFYTGLLSLRLVKRTVNFDDPGTYHFYFGNESGTPGTILTFFPWANAARGRAGAGMASASAYAVPPDALGAWMTRFADAAYAFDAPRERFGQTVLAFEDPDGLPLEIIADPRAASQPAWGGGTVPTEAALRGFHSTTLCLARPETTARILTDLLGFEAAGEEDGRLRFHLPGSDTTVPGTVIDLVRPPNATPARPGKGTVHHIAFRARDDDEQRAWREAVAAAGLQVTTVQDRRYFRSIYFREPGGVLFEIATDAPGFLTDETPESLGTTLKLPPWLEPQRERIETRLAPITVPEGAA